MGGEAIVGAPPLHAALVSEQHVEHRGDYRGEHEPNLDRGLFEAVQRLAFNGTGKPPAPSPLSRSLQTRIAHDELFSF
jgi:hypothetical protein